MDNNYIWTRQDYVKLFERILNVSLEEDTFFVTGVGKNGKSKPKLINKKTNASCKIKAYFSQIKKELGNHCFKQYTVEEIHEKLSAKTLELIYKQMIQTKVIRDCLSSITFDQIEYEELFKKDHTEEWTNIEKTIISHEKVLSYLLDICNKEEYKSALPGNGKELLSKLKNVRTKPCKNESYIYHAERSYTGIVVEAKCTRCNFYIKYDAANHSVINKMRLATSYSDICKSINKEYDQFFTIKDFAFKVGTMLIEIRELFTGRMQELLVETNGQNIKKVTKLVNSLNGINYTYRQDKNSFAIFNKLFTVENIQNNLEHIKQEIVEEIEQHIEKISNDIAMEKQFIETLHNLDGLNIALRCINAVNGYGRTTYTELLKGSKSQKMDGYGLNSSPYYGTLKQLTKKAIEEIIAFLEEHRFIETYYVRYDPSNKYPKLRLTAAGMDKLNELSQKETQNIESARITEAMPLPFSEILTMYTSQEKAKLFKSIDISKYTEIEFMELLQFVLTQRSVYRDVIDSMIEAFSKMPEKYIPIVEMNAELETGIVKETLKMIIKSVKERKVAC